MKSRQVISDSRKNGVDAIRLDLTARQRGYCRGAEDVNTTGPCKSSVAKASLHPKNCSAGGSFPLVRCRAVGQYGTDFRAAIREAADGRLACARKLIEAVRRHAAEDRCRG
jgi:hypothetical protein